MGFDSGLQTPNAPVSEINMTPLVDVMLVLLVIFIVTVPAITHTVSVELPRASAQTTPPPAKSVRISIDAKGQILWNDQSVNQAELTARLAGAAAQTPQPELQVLGARSVAYESVLQVMAAAQRAGMTRVGFVTEPEG